MVRYMDLMDPLFTRHPFSSSTPLTSSDEFTNESSSIEITIRINEETSSVSLVNVKDCPKFPIDLSRIPLEDIKQATNNFAQENIIEKKDDNWIVYQGELSGKKLSFISISSESNLRALRVLNELTKHQNVVSLIGVCDKDSKRILVLEHPTRGGLYKNVSSTAHLTWLMRLKICLDIASAMEFLQNHPKKRKFCIDYLNSAIIHLDENWQAKIQLITPSALNFNTHKTLMPLEIYSFGVILFELLCARPAVTYDEKGGEQFLTELARNHYGRGTLSEIIDPVLRVQMNRDSFTVFLELAYQCLSEEPYLRPTISVVIEQLQNVLELQQGFEISELQQVQNIQHMKIPLEEIRSATRDLTIPHKPGKVYKADLFHFNVDKFVAENKIKRVSMEEILEYPRRKSIVAIKSIDGGYGQRTEELLQTLLCHSHENLVKLVGFCDEDDGRIHVVYEYASNGSLDEYIHSQHNNYRKYTNNPTRETMRNFFPWVIRLQFCLDAARGLNFLHNGSGKNDTILLPTRVRLLPSLKFKNRLPKKRKNDTIIHGNIKSSNILISRDGVGMIGDFGLSTNEYSDVHKLTKEYDVYSFGLVLFEVLSGALTHFKISEDDPKFLPDIVKRGFNQKELDNIIDPMLRQEFENYRSLIGNRSAESLNMFANITYRCFQDKAKGRPTMADVVEELEKAYKYHAAYEESVGRLMNAESSVNRDQQSPSDIQEIIKRSRYDVLAMNKSELIDKLLTTGVLIDNGEKHFSLSKVNCKKCHMLPAKAVINKSPDAEFTKCSSSTMSRFEEVVELQHHQAFGIKCDIETKMLSLDTAYACYLVFQLPENCEGLKCPVKARDLLNKNNKEDTIIYLRAPGPIDLYRDKRVPENREDGWMEVRVWEFVYNNEIKDNCIPMELKLVCLGGTMAGLTVCGVEFRPL